MLVSGDLKRLMLFRTAGWKKFMDNVAWLDRRMCMVFIGNRLGNT